MPAKITLTSALLAGGKSSRFGSDKALADYQGRPAWRLLWERLMALHPQQAWLSLREETPWVPAEIPVLRDAVTDAGPLGSLVTLLGKISTSHLLVLAVDLPLMPEAYLRRLVAQAAPGRGVVPQVGGWFQGLSAIYPREALPLAQEVLASPDHSIQHLVRRLQEKGLVDIHPVAPQEEVFFANFNRPEPPARCAADGSKC